jgi:hypothetical protein
MINEGIRADKDGACGVHSDQGRTLQERMKQWVINPYHNSGASFGDQYS